MSAVQSLRAGNVDEALHSLQQQVRQQAGEAKHRIFLFQLLAVKGQWQRAMDQLTVAGELDPAAAPMAQAYHAILRHEAERAEVFAGSLVPRLMGEAPAWLGALLAALRLDVAGEHAQASLHREAAFAAAPANSGSLNGEPFAWIADADTRLGPVLELLLEDGYHWVPFQRIRAIRAAAPFDLRDSVWLPVSVSWIDGGSAPGWIPSRYPGTTEQADDALLLARKTVWRAPAPGAYWGLGQRMLSTDAGDCALLELRSLVFDDVAPGGAL